MISDIPAGDGKTANSFLQCMDFNSTILPQQPADLKLPSTDTHTVPDNNNIGAIPWALSCRTMAFTSLFIFSYSLYFLHAMTNKILDEIKAWEVPCV